MLFSEKMETISFNPPFTMGKSQNCLSDPESHEDIQDTETQDQASQFSDVAKSLNSDAEQQVLFAAVLGMDSLNSDTTELKNCGYDISDKYFTQLLHDNDKTVMGFVGKEIEDKKWSEWGTHYRRCQLFQQLSEYFPQHMVQPKKNLTDFIII